jgi:rhodanese-related sulfurtransferase
MSKKLLQSSHYAQIKARTDSGLKPPKTVMETESICVTRLKGENFGRIAHNVLARYISEGEQKDDSLPQMDPIQELRDGPYPARKPHPDTLANKIILLDMRSREEYYQGHIKNALCFPGSNVSVDHEFGKLNLVRNHPDKLLVIYCDDERHGILQARVVFEKGFDNVYLLSGGYIIFKKEHPDLIQ